VVRSTNDVPNTVAGRIRATTFAGIIFSLSPGMAISTRTPPSGPRPMDVTDPTMTPRTLTSALLPRDPPASASCADTCSGPPKVPEERMNSNPSATPITTTITTPRRAWSERLSSLRTAAAI
jgi:hypothetical protein